MPEQAAVKVTAASLSEAYRRVRTELGDDAVILGTRSLTRPSADGLGLERGVEVTVARGRTVSAPGCRRDTGVDELVAKLESEVERLERRLADLADGREPDVTDAAREKDADDLVDGLVIRGTSRNTAALLAARFRAENPDTNDAASFSTWLGGQLRTADCPWESVAGIHAVIGPSGSGKTRLALAAAALVAESGGRALVLSVAPDHPGEIRRLQAAAATGEFDAAVIRRPEQVVELQKQLSEYQAVFVDLPSLEHPSMAPGGELQGWLAGHHGIHRHLLVPMDLDPAELEGYPALARELNIDWVSLGRLDRTRRPGKVLDLVEAIPLPVSLMSGEEPANIATPATLSDLITRGLVESRFETSPEDTAVEEEGR